MWRIAIMLLYKHYTFDKYVQYYDERRTSVTLVHFSHLSQVSDRTCEGLQNLIKFEKSVS